MGPTTVYKKVKLLADSVIEYYLEKLKQEMKIGKLSYLIRKNKPFKWDLAQKKIQSAKKVFQQTSS